MDELLTEYFEDLEAWVLCSCDYDFAHQVLSEYQSRTENDHWMQLIRENMLIDESRGKFMSDNENVLKILLLQYWLWVASGAGEYFIDANLASKSVS